MGIEAILDSDDDLMRVAGRAPYGPLVASCLVRSADHDRDSAPGFADERNRSSMIDNASRFEFERELGLHDPVAGMGLQRDGRVDRLAQAAHGHQRRAERGFRRRWTRGCPVLGRQTNRRAAATRRSVCSAGPLTCDSKLQPAYPGLQRFRHASDLGDRSLESDPQPAKRGRGRGEQWFFVPGGPGQQIPPPKEAPERGPDRPVARLSRDRRFAAHHERRSRAPAGP